MQLGRYTVVRKLGEGGMATAYLANSPAGEEVVLKVPHQGSTEASASVRDEARIGLRLSHPHIVETLDLFEHQGKPVLVVRYVEGCSLREAWRGGPMSAAAVARVGAHIADALHAIHQATDEHGRPLETLHRDVAPGNVLLTIDGDAQLIDLGIARSVEREAKRTAIGVIKGTLRYLAPEVLNGGDYSAASDTWALGVCLWEAALGRRAVGGDERDTIVAIVRGALTRLEPGELMEPRLLALLQRTLAVGGERLADAGALAAALRDLETELGGGTEALRAHVSKLPRGDNLGEVHSLEGDAAVGGEPAATVLLPAVDPVAQSGGAATLQLPAFDVAAAPAAPANRPLHLVPIAVGATLAVLALVAAVLALR